MKYTYRCNTCHYEFDKELSLSQIANAAKSPKFPCPNCKGTTRKLINKPAIHYRGTGWYSTDNKK